jgi:hypothetical protein
MTPSQVAGPYPMRSSSMHASLLPEPCPHHTVAGGLVAGIEGETTSRALRSGGLALHCVLLGHKRVDGYRTWGGLGAEGRRPRLGEQGIGDRG